MNLYQHYYDLFFDLGFLFDKLYSQTLGLRPFNCINGVDIPSFAYTNFGNMYLWRQEIKEHQNNTVNDTKAIKEKYNAVLRNNMKYIFFVEGVINCEHIKKDIPAKKLEGIIETLERIKQRIIKRVPNET